MSEQNSVNVIDLNKPLDFRGEAPEPKKFLTLGELKGRIRDLEDANGAWRERCAAQQRELQVLRDCNRMMTRSLDAILALSGAEDIGPLRLDEAGF